jgi:hypothetical protein
LLLLQDVLSLLRESASALALHDSNADRQLDCSEFAGFMARFMAAAGYQLEQVLDELLLLAATKVCKQVAGLFNASPAVSRPQQFFLVAHDSYWFAAHPGAAATVSFGN